MVTLTALSEANPTPEFNLEELENSLETVANFKYIATWNEASPTVTPDGTDKLAKDTKFGITFPFKAAIVGFYLTFDTSITRGNAANDYTANILNSSTLLLATAQSVGTLAAGTKIWIPADQNKEVTVGDTIKLRLNQLDGASAAPTDISAAKLLIEVVYTRS